MSLAVFGDLGEEVEKHCSIPSTAGSNSNVTGAGPTGTQEAEQGHCWDSGELQQQHSPAFLFLLLCVKIYLSARVCTLIVPPTSVPINTHFRNIRLLWMVRFLLPNNLLLGIFHMIHKWDYLLWDLITADEKTENKNMACTWAMLLSCSWTIAWESQQNTWGIQAIYWCRIPLSMLWICFIVMVNKEAALGQWCNRLEERVLK